LRLAHDAADTRAELFRKDEVRISAQLQEQPMVYVTNTSPNSRS
jgi:hypothetical protein